MRENTALRAWRAGKGTVGCWLSMANTYSAESLASIGFDWVCVDLQHGLIDYQDLVHHAARDFQFEGHTAGACTVE